MPITPAQLHDPIIEYVQPAALKLDPSDTVDTALARARQLPSTQIILYCYVVDSDERLVGIVPIRRLLTTAAEARIDSIMIHDVEAIPSWATVLVAAEYFVNRRFLAFPVVEPGGRLVGVVDVGLFTDDVLVLARQSFDGIFQLIGVHATEGLTAWSSFKDRFPWLLCNVVGGLLCAILASRYESLLDHLVVLALFIPVVLTLAEAVSIQSLTLTLQNLSDAPLSVKAVARGVGQEFVTALMLGIGCGAIVGLAAFVWKGAIGVGLVLVLAITLAMITACLLGVLMPTALRAMKADPKIAAGPIVLALTDLATLLFYFNLAGILMQ